MSTVVDDRSVSAHVAERTTMTAADLGELAEKTSRELLGVTAEEAFRMLDDGELSGQAVEGTLRGIKRLLVA